MAANPWEIVSEEPESATPAAGDPWAVVSEEPAMPMPPAPQIGVDDTVVPSTRVSAVPSFGQALRGSLLANPLAHGLVRGYDLAQAAMRSSTMTEAALPERTWGETVTALPRQVGSALSQQIAGMKAASVQQDLDDLERMNPGVDSPLKQDLRRIRDEALAVAREAEMDVSQLEALSRPSLLQKGVTGAATSLAVSAPALVTGLVTRNPTLAAGAAFPGTEGQAFASLANANVNPTAALRHGALQGIIETGTELLPAAQLFKRGGPAYQRLLNFMAAELPGESIATLGQGLDDYIARLPGDVTGSDVIAGLRKAAADLPETWVSTILAGGAQHGIVNAPQALGDVVNRLTPAPPRATPQEASLIDAIYGRASQGTPLAPVDQAAATLPTPAAPAEGSPAPAPPEGPSKTSALGQETATPPAPPISLTSPSPAAAPEQEAPPATPAPSVAAPSPAPQPEPVSTDAGTPAGGATPPPVSQAPVAKPETAAPVPEPESFEARVQRNAKDLEFMAGGAGWEVEGGKLIRGQRSGESEGEGDKVVGRTEWIPRAPWFKEVQSAAVATGTKRTRLPRAQQTALPNNNDGAATREAVRKALAGEKLSLPEQRHIGAMLAIAERDREQAAAEGLNPDEFDPFAANEAAGRSWLADDDTASGVDMALVDRARQIDEARVESLAKQYENDDTAFFDQIRAMIADHDQSPTRAAGIEAVPPAGERAQEPEALRLEAQDAAPAEEVTRAASQPDMFGRNQTQQDIADRQRQQDARRSPGTDVPADIDGGLFSNRNRQRDITEASRAESPDSGESAPVEDEVGYGVEEGDLTDEEFERYFGAVGGNAAQASEQSGGEAGRSTGAPAAGGRSEGRPPASHRSAGTHQVYRGSAQPLTPAHFEPSALGFATGHPSSSLGVYFTSDPVEAARYGTVRGHGVTLNNPRAYDSADLPEFDSAEEYQRFAQQLRAKGHDGIVIDFRDIGKKRTHYVAFAPDQVADSEAPAPAQAEETEPDEIDLSSEFGEGVEASMPQPSAERSSRAKPAEDKSKPSTTRENLMNALGIDPTTFRLKGGMEQFKIVRKALMDRYGFKNIGKHTSQNWRNATDHLLDAFESLQNMAAALGTSAREVSLNGKLALQLQRNTKAKGYFIYPHNIISVFDQEDVYAHEYGHALDYHLMEEAGAMQPGGLSAMIRKREDTSTLPATIGQAYADLMTALYYDGAHIAQAIKKAEHQLEKTMSPDRRKQLEKRLKNLRSGAWRGRGGKTQFYQRAKQGPMAAYLSKPTELVARSFEAYLSAKIHAQKDLGLVRFLGSTDAIYSDKADAWIARIYPQDSDRAQIFAAWDNLIGQLTREGLYDTSQPVGYADSQLNLGLMDPVAQAKAAGLPITPDIVRDKNLTHKAAETYIKDEIKRRDSLMSNIRAFNNGIREGSGDTLANLNSLMRNFMQTPDGVFSFLETKFPQIRVLRTIRDNFSDAQIHGRNKPLGIYREIARTESQLVNQLTERLQAVGIVPNMDEKWISRMWDVMHGYTQPANATERRQADQMRYEYDRLFKLRDQHGVGLGYTAEPYMNRILHPLVADDVKFQAALVKLREAERDELLTKLGDQLSKATTEEEEKALKDKIKAAQRIDPQADTVNQLAAMKGLTWGGPVTLGAANEDSAKERVFGPLADEILKDFYVQDPVDLLSTYAASAAREMVMGRRLGKNPNSTIQGWLNQAAAKLPTAYADLLMHAMQTSLGIQSIKTTMAGSKVLHAYAAISNAHMLGRASIPNISEPLGVLSKSLAPARTLLQLVQTSIPLLRSQSKKARYASADRFGRLSGILVDAAHAMTAQAQVTGEDTQGKGLVARFSAKAYMFNLMTPLTSLQEKVINRLGLEMFYDAAESIRAKDADADVYRQWLREHGIKSADAFADFLKGPKAVDALTFEDTLSGPGLQLANALEHFVRTTIQKPTPSTKLLLSNRGNFGLIFRLTSWMTTNFRNWAVQNKAKVASAITGKYGDAQLTAKQRVSAMAMPVMSTLLTMYVAQAFFVVARMMLTHSDEWEERGESLSERLLNPKTQMQILQYWGTLGWLASTVIDVAQGTRFNRGLFATLAGPVYGPLVQDVERFVQFFSKNSERTNTQERNAVEGAYHFLSMMTTFGLLSILPTTTAWGRAVGFWWSFFGTSPQSSKNAATFVAGEKQDTRSKSPTAAVDSQLRQTMKPINDQVREATTGGTP